MKTQQPIIQTELKQRLFRYESHFPSFVAE